MDAKIAVLEKKLEKNLTQQHVEEAVNILISRESSAYIALWEGLTINQKNLMCALAWEDHPEVFSKKFCTGC
ncbi:MAG: hypothetical protein LWX02_11235 [Deltaproteobacteria bacterium]|jgi:hypothetical protein|nr:hypothetical protein [Deltaproteobacteria bacterium]MDL1986087.1 hypothetical protein [Deltaproteobacteria bacterium]MDL2121608.1 hypothetical protein [Deltaproteobacteria bacterium]